VWTGWLKVTGLRDPSPENLTKESSALRPNRPTPTESGLTAMFYASGNCLQRELTVAHRRLIRSELSGQVASHKQTCWTAGAPVLVGAGAPPARASNARLWSLAPRLRNAGILPAVAGAGRSRKTLLSKLETLSRMIRSPTKPILDGPRQDD
jgi:hypothetical protein